MNLFIKNIKTILSQKQKSGIITLHILMLASSLLEVCGISSVFPILSVLLDKDFMYTNMYAVALCDFLEINSYNVFVFVCVLGLFIIFLVKNTFLLIKNNYQAKFALDFQNDIRRRAFRAYLKKDYRFFLNNNSSDIAKTLLDDVSKTYLSFDSLLTITTEIIVNIFLIITVFIIDWKISLGVLCIIAIIFLIITQSVRPIIKKTGELANRSVKIRNKWIKQAIECIKVVIVTQKGEYFENKEYESDLEFSYAEKKHKVLSELPKIIIEMFSITFIAGFAIVIAVSGSNLELIIPKLGAIGLAAIKLLPGVNTIISNVVSIQYRMPFAERIVELLEEEPKNSREKALPNTYEREIRVENLCFRYDEDRNSIFNNASLVIPIGKMVGIVGASGDGKTTFLDILLGLLDAKGEITVDDININESISSWRNSIGYITQNTFLLDDSVLANVAFGVDNDEVDEKRAWIALEKAQISTFIKDLPSGIYTQIGEKGVRLSGGQCQRIDIARALYANPQILIFDEATSSLDSETEKAVVESIYGLYGKHTIIVVAHRSVALEHCDKIYRITNGKFYEL